MPSSLPSAAAAATVDVDAGSGAGDAAWPFVAGFRASLSPEALPAASAWGCCCTATGGSTPALRCRKAPHSRCSVPGNWSKIAKRLQRERNQSALQQMCLLWDCAAGRRRTPDAPCPGTGRRSQSACRAVRRALRAYCQAASAHGIDVAEGV